MDALRAWKYVPYEPTEEMLHAAEDVDTPRPFGKVYRAMLDAAPKRDYHHVLISNEIRDEFRAAFDRWQSPKADNGSELAGLICEFFEFRDEPKRADMQTNAEMKGVHTATPWNNVPNDGPLAMPGTGHLYNVVHIKGRVVTAVAENVQFDDAVFIRRACNAHDDLVSALEKALNYIGGKILLDQLNVDDLWRALAQARRGEKATADCRADKL